MLHAFGGPGREFYPANCKVLLVMRTVTLYRARTLDPPDESCVLESLACAPPSTLDLLAWSSSALEYLKRRTLRPWNGSPK